MAGVGTGVEVRVVGTFLFSFGKGEEGTQTVLLETSGQTLSSTCVSDSSASLGPALGEPIILGAGQTYMAQPPAEFFGSWLCRLQPDFQERPRWPLRVKMLPPPHLPGQRVLISYQVPRMKPQSAWQPLLCTGGEAEKVWVP